MRKYIYKGLLQSVTGTTIACREYVTHTIEIQVFITGRNSHMFNSKEEFSMSFVPIDHINVEQTAHSVERYVYM